MENALLLLFQFLIKKKNYDEYITIYYIRKLNHISFIFYIYESYTYEGFFMF